MGEGCSWSWFLVTVKDAGLQMTSGSTLEVHGFRQHTPAGSTALLGRSCSTGWVWEQLVPFPAPAPPASNLLPLEVTLV